MRFPRRLQLLIFLMVYASSVHSIMVKYGTKEGPIEPPVPVPSLPPAQPYRAPAPVWEERSNDKADPNAQWRPQLFVPQPRYTQVIFNPAPQQPLNNAQRFVNSYIPNRQPIQAKPITNYFSPSQVLSSQSLPGFGIRYFVPTYRHDVNEKRKEDSKQNDIETNEIHNSNQDLNELQWKLEKDSSKRFARTTQEAPAYVYQWPVFVPRQQQY